MEDRETGMGQESNEQNLAPREHAPSGRRFSGVYTASHII